MYIFGRVIIFGECDKLSDQLFAFFNAETRLTDVGIERSTFLDHTIDRAVNIIVGYCLTVLASYQLLCVTGWIDTQIS